MRVMLDVHPKIRCGPETHVLPQFLHLYTHKVSPQVNKLLLSASITDETVDIIYVNIIKTLLHRTGPDAERLCVKDPFIDYHIKYLLNLHPNARFVLMVRDGRAVASSIMR